MKRIALLPLALLMLQACDPSDGSYTIQGEQRTWHTLTFSFQGPACSEESYPNPFLNYRLVVDFVQGKDTIRVPGFFAADGNAAESSSLEGSTWQVRFKAPSEGQWEFITSFREGHHIALSADPDAGQPVSVDGMRGSFMVEPTDKEGRDFRAHGRLEYVGERYLRHQGSGKYFLKGGADSPENFLAYHEFDGTYYGGNRVHRDGEDTPNDRLHRYEAHVADWNEGDPLWQGSKGKGIIGALNYLASQGMNSVYFLTMNVLGDGDDVWPWSSREERYRFDVSRLEQWELVFSHMEKLGIMMHMVLQETENEVLLDAGRLDVQRKLYLRELVARFGHHLAITWNIGEENGPDTWTPVGQTVDMRKAMMSYLKEINPYNSFVVVHTHAADPVHSELIEPFLGFEDLDGPSLQLHRPQIVHDYTKHWIQASSGSGKQWVVCLDELGPYWMGVMPDSHDPDHDTIRQEALWGNLMAGGAGVEWYFGYKYPHADLNAEDWRSRANMWKQTHIALEFFNEHLPFWEMQSSDELVRGGFGFSLETQLYVAYFPKGTGRIDLRNAEGSFQVRWYNPRTGGSLLQGDVSTLQAGSWGNPGQAPEPEAGQGGADWVCLLRKAGA